jgi:hypothetical protein
VSAKELIQGVPRVVDGDTLDFSGTRVRLFGIDAPETKQSCTAAKGGDYLCGELCSNVCFHDCCGNQASAVFALRNHLPCLPTLSCA